MLTNELTQIVELDCAPVIAAVEAELLGLEKGRALPLSEPADHARQFTWTATEPELSDELPYSALRWVNKTLADGRTNAAYARSLTRAGILLEQGGAAGIGGFVLDIPLPKPVAGSSTTVAAAAAGAGSGSTVAAAAAAAVVATTGSPGLPFPPPINVSVPLGRLGTGTLTLTALSLAGLDTITLASVALVDSHSLSAAIEVGQLIARATVRLQVTPLTPEEEERMVAKEVAEEEANAAEDASYGGAAYPGSSHGDAGGVYSDGTAVSGPPLVPDGQATPGVTDTPPMHAHDASGACDCSWTRGLACSSSTHAGGTGWASDDGSDCFRSCCPVALHEEVEVALSLVNVSAEALISIGIDTVVAARTPISVLLDNARCARDVLGLTARHLSLRLTPGALTLTRVARGGGGEPGGAPLVDAGDGDLESAFSKVISDALRLVIASSTERAVSTLIDAAVGGPMLERLNRILSAPQGDDAHDVIGNECGTRPPAALPGEPQVNTGAEDAVMTRLNELFRDPSSNGSYTKPKVNRHGPARPREHSVACLRATRLLRSRLLPTSNNSKTHPAARVHSGAPPSSRPSTPRWRLVSRPSTPRRAPTASCPRLACIASTSPAMCYSSSSWRPSPSRRPSMSPSPSSRSAVWTASIGFCTAARHAATCGWMRLRAAPSPRREGAAKRSAKTPSPSCRPPRHSPVPPSRSRATVCPQSPSEPRWASGCLASHFAGAPT